LVFRDVEFIGKKNELRDNKIYYKGNHGVVENRMIIKIK
jgi:hypothetical protein